MQKTSPGSPLSDRPAKLLDRCLIEAGIDRARIYVTNAVKHFKIGVGKVWASPPSEPCERFSRTRLSGCWFPHRGCLA
jgi:uracil-DNA glycosylase